MMSDHISIDQRFTELFKITFGFTEEEYNLFISHFVVRQIRKKVNYFTPGHVCKAKAYINKGCFRNYIIDENGHERVLYFAFEDWWLADLDSYYSGNPGIHFIQALEDSEIFEISKEDFTAMEKEIPKLSQWYTTKLTRNASKSMQRIEEMKTLSLEERYLKLLDESPQIFHRVPLQYIASYLNVEPQSLSRLRKRLLKN